MTQEEIIQAISDDKMMPFIQPEQLVQIVEFVINNYRPSLPSDLEEAAIPELEMDEWMKYGPHTNYPWCSVPDAIKITAEHFFALGKQAGAEWMAGQGIYADAKICKLAGRAWVTPINEKRFQCDVYDNFTVDDKVIVQIRKK